jgi:hypothetical protein
MSYLNFAEMRTAVAASVVEDTREPIFPDAKGPRFQL